MIYLYLFAGILVYVIRKGKKYKSPFKVITIFGKKRSGKTTLLQKFAIQYQRKGYKVFSNVELFGCYQLDVATLGKVQYPYRSVLIVDEASMYWDGRNFKSFDLALSDYLRMIGHFGNVVIFASQTFDIDKRLRDQTDEMYLCSNVLGFFSIAKKIRKKPTLHKPLEVEGRTSGEGYIADDYRFELPLFWKYTYIPRWAKFFNSFEYTPLTPVQMIIYKFKDYAKLYRLKSYRYYKLDQIRNTVKEIRKKYKEVRGSLRVSGQFYMSMQYQGSLPIRSDPYFLFMAYMKERKESQ